MQQTSASHSNGLPDCFGAARGVLIVGHGTADTVGAEETHVVARRVASLLPGVPVELGFLEVIGPSIAEALERLAASGCREVVAAPLLLFNAGHARKDVPEAILKGARLAGLIVRQADPLACHEQIVALAKQRRREALECLASVPAEATVLVMVGRGSSDPDAYRQLEEFTAATLSTPVGNEMVVSQFGHIELGFVAAARPTLAQAIAAATARRHSHHGGPVLRIVVQPHLLFRGHVQDTVAESVVHGRQHFPSIEWIEVGRLGPDDLVARALLDRASCVVWPSALEPRA